MDTLVDRVMDRIIRAENGGCDPVEDPVIKLKAENRGRNGLWVFVVGKWRPIRYYGGSKAIPSKKVQEEMARTVRLNTGWNKIPGLDVKPIEFIWQ